MLILDAGALVAIERGDRRVNALLKLARQNEIDVQTSAAAVAQVWRSGPRQARLARALPGIEAIALDLSAAKQIGVVNELAGARDVVDAHVARLASTGDRILTSDPGDLQRLVDARRVHAVVTRV